MVAADGPGEFPVVAASRAGDDCSQLRLEPGSVVYITTGGGICFSCLLSEFHQKHSAMKLSSF